MWVGREQFLNSKVHKVFVETIISSSWNIKTSQPNKHISNFSLSWPEGKNKKEAVLDSFKSS